ncbi:MAG: hypothetical protein AWU54_2200 [Candidatus Frackibacter sp. T328-2]|nr:MAG: hypothetical protein AWU54_2200 [Candidatus Frackibacter sp. T328-2]
MLDSKKFLVVGLVFVLILLFSQSLLYGADYASLTKEELIKEYRTSKSEFVELRAKHTNLAKYYEELKVKYDELKDKVLANGCDLEPKEKEAGNKRTPAISQITLNKVDYSSLNKMKLIDEHRSLMIELNRLKGKYTELVDYYGELKLKYDELQDKLENGCDSKEEESSVKKAPTGC